MTSGEVAWFTLALMVFFTLGFIAGFKAGGGDG